MFKKVARPEKGSFDDLRIQFLTAAKRGNFNHMKKVVEYSKKKFEYTILSSTSTTEKKNVFHYLSDYFATLSKEDLLNYVSPSPAFKVDPQYQGFLHFSNFIKEASLQRLIDVRLGTDLTPYERMATLFEADKSLKPFSHLMENFDIIPTTFQQSNFTQKFRYPLMLIMLKEIVSSASSTDTLVVGPGSLNDPNAGLYSPELFELKLVCPSLNLTVVEGNSEVLSICDSVPTEDGLRDFPKEWGDLKLPRVIPPDFSLDVEKIHRSVFFGINSKEEVVLVENDRQFDFVIMNNILQYTLDPKRVHYSKMNQFNYYKSIFRFLLSHLKPGGHLIISSNDIKSLNPSESLRDILHLLFNGIHLPIDVKGVLPSDSTDINKSTHVVFRDISHMQG